VQVASVPGMAAACGWRSMVERDPGASTGLSLRSIQSAWRAKGADRALQALPIRSVSPRYHRACQQVSPPMWRGVPGLRRGHSQRSRSRADFATAVRRHTAWRRSGRVGSGPACAGDAVGGTSGLGRDSHRLVPHLNSQARPWQRSRPILCVTRSAAAACLIATGRFRG
jgi:hypothetical protein